MASTYTKQIQSQWSPPSRPLHAHPSPSSTLSSEAPKFSSPSFTLLGRAHGCLGLLAVAGYASYLGFISILFTHSALQETGDLCSQLPREPSKNSSQVRRAALYLEIAAQAPGLKGSMFFNLQARDGGEGVTGRPVATGIRAHQQSSSLSDGPYSIHTAFLPLRGIRHVEEICL